MGISIEVSNVGKKYIISHRQKERYSTLRETVPRKIKSIFERSSNSIEEFWALRDVSFEISQGDRVGIIGNNGAGKSTLLKVLSRITEPTNGKIKISGRIASLLEVGTGFHPELTGRENVFLNGAILGMRKDEIQNKFDEIVEFAGVERFLDTPVKRYSSGMYVRLAFSVAAHLNPEILIVDEVLSVGDAEFQKKCFGKIQDVGKSGKTVLIVSHNMSSIMSICSTAILLERGALIAHGNTGDVVNKYLAENVHAAVGYFDLTDEKLRKNSMSETKFRWKSAQIINSNQVSTSHIHLNEPFKILLEADVLCDIKDVILGFGVVSELGFTVFNSHNIDCDVTRDFNEGVAKIEINFENNYFAPGGYTFDLGANGSRVVDWLPEAFNLRIDPVSKSGIAVRPTFSGIAMFPCNWSVKNT